MSYQGLTFALMVGVAIGTAIYYYFKNENPPGGYQYQPRDERSYNSSRRTSDTSETNPRRRGVTEGSESCSICLDKLVKAGKLYKIRRVSCGHIFHEHCLTTWLRSNPSCPNCRANL